MQKHSTTSVAAASLRRPLAGQSRLVGEAMRSVAGRNLSAYPNCGFGIWPITASGGGGEVFSDSA